MYFTTHVHFVIVADRNEVELTASKEKEQQLQSELDMTEHSKNKSILKLEEELQAKQKAMAFLAGQFEQKQRELEMLKQHGKARVCGADSTCIAVMY